jgi:hypothetical protein
MAYAFVPRDEEPEAQAGGRRYGGPPRKYTGVGVLDPPVPPKKPIGPIPAIPRHLIKFLAALILIGLVAAVLAMIWKSF